MKNTLSQKQLAFCRHYVRTRNGREAAAAAGFLLFPEKTAARLLTDARIRGEIERLEADCKASRAELIAGYRRLAFGSTADAVRLLLHCDDTPPDPDTLDLFSVSEIKRPKGGGMEIKFFDRIQALQCMQELEGENSASGFYQALEAGAKALGGE